MNILIFDKNSNSRNRIKAIISKKMPQARMMETGVVNEAIELFCSIKLDLMIMDIDVSENILEKIKSNTLKLSGQLPVIGLTLFDEVFFPVTYFRFGAHGFLHKGFREHELLQAIKTVLNGEKHINDDLNQLLAKYVSNSSISSPFELLDNRELLITQEILKGKNMYQVAGSINSSKDTVEKLLKIVYSKMGVAYGDVSALISLANKYHEL